MTEVASVHLQICHMYVQVGMCEGFHWLLYTNYTSDFQNMRKRGRTGGSVSVHKHTHS